MEIRVNPNTPARAGVFANVVTLSSNDGVAFIDFVLADNEHDGVMDGVLASRVFMSDKTLLQLRDLICEHVDKFGLDHV